MYKKMPVRRYRHTLEFLESNLPTPAKVLDLGVRNPFSEWMEEAGYEVINTEGLDLDLDTSEAQRADIDAVTAFEILEHLVNPMPLLQAIKAPKLIATVPMRLWFAPAYQSATDERDRHYHEFEDWQFNWLIEKSGWKIDATHQWTSPSPHPFGIRPFLRQFTPRYYAVSASR